MAEVAPAPSSQLVTHHCNPTKHLTITLPLRRSLYSPPSSATFPPDLYPPTDIDSGFGLKKSGYLRPLYTTNLAPGAVDHLATFDQINIGLDRVRRDKVPLSMLFSAPSSALISIPRGLPPIIVPMDVPMQGYDQRPPSRTGGGGGYADTSTEMGGPSSDLAPRKRSKVSRACDECRRKKIRCDATSETGVEQCSSCKRVGARCSFSRVPMKRGPSKGYIKELADRLNTLENTISTSDMHPYVTSVEGESSPMESEETSPPPNLGLRPSRKRTLSSSSEFPLGMHLQPLAQSSTLPRSGERLPPIDSFHSPHHQQAPQIPQRQLPPPHIPPPHSSSGLRSQRGSISSASVSQPLVAHSSPTSGSSSSWRPDHSEELRRQSLSRPLEPLDMTMSSNILKGQGKSFDWDEPTIDQYYAIIHPTFPFLPHSKLRLRSRLSHASSRVREAFLQALYCAVRSNPASTLIPTGPFESRGVAELAFAAQYEDPASRPIADNLAYLQTLIFLILEADNRGPAAIKGQFGPPRALWLGAAIGLAYNLRLHHGYAATRPSEDHDDGDEKLGRRAWWTLVVLDRWNAVSTSSPLHIPDSSVILLPEDQSLLGPAAYHITRLSMILGHLAENLTSSEQAVSSPTGGAYVSRLLRGELERFRESVDSVLGSLNLVHIAYWHVKLLSLRLSDATEPSQLMGPATRIATILNSVQTLVTPLSYHFAALAILTLVDLLEYGETRVEAEKGIVLIVEAMEKRRGISTREDGAGWDRTVKDFISRRTQQQQQLRTNSGANTTSGKHPLPHGNLQHLAELAVGEGAGGPGASGMSAEARYPVIDTHMLQKYGYLGCLVL